MPKIFTDLPQLSGKFNLPQFLAEDNINLETNDVDAAEGQKRIALGNSNLLYNTRVIPNSLLATIPKLQLDILFREVSSPPLQGGYITALKVFFASENINGVDILTLLYQPVRLFYRFYDGGSLKHMYQIGFSGKIYSFKNDQFVICQDAEELIKDYTTKIKIKRTTELGAAFEGHVIDSDTKYMLFPFQLIYTVMSDNDNDILEIKNVATGIRGSGDTPFFHSILLHSPLLGPPRTEDRIFAGIYADRSHLCPPAREIYFGFIRL